MTAGPRKLFQQRNLIGIAAIVCVLAAVYLLLFQSGQYSSVSGILIKVGLMLSAIWLAFPKIQGRQGRDSFLILIVLCGLLFLLAARPRIFVIACAVAIAALAVNWLLKRISKSS